MQDKAPLLVDFLNLGALSDPRARRCSASILTSADEALVSLQGCLSGKRSMLAAAELVREVSTMFSVSCFYTARRNGFQSICGISLNTVQINFIVVDQLSCSELE